MTAPGVDAAGGQPVAVIARVLDLDPRRVQQLANEGVIPRARRGRYPLVGAVQGYIRFLRQLAEGKGGADSATRLNSQRARLAEAQAEHQEMVNAQRRGELAPVGDLEFAVTQLLSGVRSRIRAVPSKVALDVSAESEPALCQDLMLRALDEALEEIANVRVLGLLDAESAADATPRSDEDPAERGVSHAPASAAKRRRVGRARAKDPTRKS